MRTLHGSMIGITVSAALLLSLGAFHHDAAAMAQEGHHGDAQRGHENADGTMQDHFHAIIEHLELSDAQHETLAGPFAEAFAAAEELHRLHGVIAAELTEEQQETLTGILHEMMGPAPEVRHSGAGHGFLH